MAGCLLAFSHCHITDVNERTGAFFWLMEGEISFSSCHTHARKPAFVVSVLFSREEMYRVNERRNISKLRLMVPKWLLL